MQLQEFSKELPTQHPPRPPGKPRTASRSRSSQPTRAMSAFLPHRKYDNVQKIAGVIDQLRSRDSHQKSSHNAGTSTQAQRIIQSFRDKIRSNFNQLYENYEGNRDTINTQIRQLQKNKTVHTEMNNKFQLTLKEKNQYDKVRSEVKLKQRQLERLREVLKKEMDWKHESEELKEMLDARIDEMRDCEERRLAMEYQRKVLISMREDRRKLRQEIKDRFNRDWRKWSDTNRLINKFWNQNEAKKVMLNQLALKMPKNVTMPEKLAMQLETKLEEYYGKQAYLNIFQHENTLNEQANRRQQMRLQSERDAQRRRKLEEERKQKKNYEEIEKKLQVLKVEEEKARKTCGVNDLEQMSTQIVKIDQQSLNRLKQEYDEKLAEIQKENADLQAQIQHVLSLDTRTEQDLRAIQKQKQFQHEQEVKLFNQAQKCKKMLEQLMFVVERVTEEPGTKKDMNLMLAAFSSKMERLVLLQKLDRPKVPKQTKVKTLHLQSLQADQQASREDQQQDYVDTMFRSKAQ